MFILEGTGQTGSPTDTAISTEHVHYRSTRLDSSEQTGTGSQISHLVTTPAVTLGTDTLFVYITSGQHFVYTWHHAIVAAFARITVTIAYIRIEDNVTVAQIHAIIDGRTVRFRHTIFVQSFRVTFVKVYDHRILLVRIEVSRLVDDTFQFTAVQRCPWNQLGSSPNIRFLLLDALSKLDAFLERSVCSPYIRKYFKVFTGIDVLVRFLGFQYMVIIVCSSSQKCRLGWRRQTGTINTGTLVRFIETDHHHRFLQVNVFFLSVQCNVAVGYLVFTTVLGQSDRCLFAFRIEWPDVITVVNQYGSIILCPTGISMRRRIVRCIVILIPCRESLRSSQLNLAVIRQIDGIPATVCLVISSSILAGSRQTVACIIGLGNQGTFTGCQRYFIIIGTSTTFPHGRQGIWLGSGYNRPIAHALYRKYCIR